MLSPLITTLPVSISTKKIVFPKESFTCILPDVITSAVRPVAFKYLTIVSPSTVIPALYVFPPSVETPHASAVIFQIILESFSCGLLCNLFRLLYKFRKNYSICFSIHLMLFACLFFLVQSASCIPHNFWSLRNILQHYFFLYSQH